MDNKLKAVNGFVGQLSYIYVDPNQQLPNGQPNPNAGKLYSQSQPTIIDAPTAATNYRVMTSYGFDFARRSSNWARFLGRHATALFFEQDNTSGWSSNNGLFNTTPLAKTGAAATISNGANGIQYRYYYDPAAHKVGTSVARHLEAIPILHANDPPPAPSPTGITPAFLPQQGPTIADQAKPAHVRRAHPTRKNQRRLAVPLLSPSHHETPPPRVPWRSCFVRFLRRSARRRDDSIRPAPQHRRLHLRRSRHARLAGLRLDGSAHAAHGAPRRRWDEVYPRLHRYA